MDINVTFHIFIDLILKSIKVSITSYFYDFDKCIGMCALWVPYDSVFYLMHRIPFLRSICFILYDININL